MLRGICLPQAADPSQHTKVSVPPQAARKNLPIALAKKAEKISFEHVSSVDILYIAMSCLK